MTRLRNMLLLATALVVIGGCETTQVTSCDVSLRGPLPAAISAVEGKLEAGCEYHFDHYFEQLLDVAVANPDRANIEHFSGFLVRTSDRAIISKRQAKALYNRYFNVKFVSLAGDFNTCSMTCPTRKRVLADMQNELLDKERGLVQASENPEAYYRSDLLLKEAQLVLEATCRACAAGAGQ